MQPDARYAAYLEQQYRFSEWKEPGRADRAGTVDPFTGAEFPGWTLQRSTTRPLPDGITLTRAIWQGGVADVARVLDVELFECASAAAARRYLLALLGDLQGPVAVRDSAAALGSLAFRLGGDSTIVFVRGHVVVRVRNAGREVVSVLDVAQRIDRRLLPRTDAQAEP